MFKTKKDIDRHVRINLTKLNENEKKCRGFTIAKLYYKINDFASAAYYLSEYLSVYKEKSSAYKLHGQCMLKLNKVNQALDSFQSSLRFDPNQPELLNEVCKIYLECDALDEFSADFWCNMAEKMKVYDDNIFNLRLKILEKQKKPKKIEVSLLIDILKHSKNSKLRIHFIEYLLKRNKIFEAFQSISILELKVNDVLIYSVEWQNVIENVLSKIKELTDTSKNWDYTILKTFFLEKKLFSSFYFQTSSSIFDSSMIENNLFEFDQHLYALTKLNTGFCQNLYKELLNHYGGQLFLYIAAFFYQRTMVSNENWRETMIKTFPLLSLAFQCKPIDKDAKWIETLEEDKINLIKIFHKEGVFRCSQAGSIILSCLNKFCNLKMINANKSKDSLNKISLEDISSGSNLFITEVKEFYNGKKWREEIYNEAFSFKERKEKISSSYFILCHDMEDIFNFPIKMKVETNNRIAAKYLFGSLHHVTYIFLGADFWGKGFDICQNNSLFSTKNLHNCDAETLNSLDVETFLYACLFQANRNLELVSNKTERPVILPFVNTLSSLCTEEQSLWWKLAFNFRRGIVDGNINEVRVILQKGIEAVRGLSKEVDLNIMFCLGRILIERVNITTNEYEKNFLQSRAQFLFENALLLFKENETVLGFKKSYFLYAESFLNEKCLIKFVEDAVQYMSKVYFQNYEYEHCIDVFKGINIPIAMFYVSEATKYLEKVDCQKKKDDFEIKSSSMNHKVRNINRMCELQYNKNATGNEAHLKQPLHLHSVQKYNDYIDNFENISKQTQSVLSNIKFELFENIKPELSEVHKEVIDLKSKIDSLENKININLWGKTANNGNLICSCQQRTLFQTSNEQLTPNANNLFPQKDAAHLEKNFDSFLSNSLLTPHGQYSSLEKEKSENNETILDVNKVNEVIQNLNDKKTSSGNKSTFFFGDSTNKPQIESCNKNYFTNSNKKISFITLEKPNEKLSLSNSNSLENLNLINLSASKSVVGQSDIAVLETNIDSYSGRNEKMGIKLSFDKPENNSRPTFFESNIKEKCIASSCKDKEKLLFNEKADLFKFVDKEWKEYGFGFIEILENEQSGAYIIFMKQDLTQKICVNQKITDMIFCPSSDKDDKSFIWEAQNSSEEQVSLEKFCVKFEQIETAQEFYNLIKKIKNQRKHDNIEQNYIQSIQGRKHLSVENKNVIETVSHFGNLDASSNPHYNPFEFIQFSNINKTNTPLNDVCSLDQCTEEEEYISTAQFKPVISLPDLVELETGEENEDIIFENRAKLFRYDKEISEWKERGVGNIKVLQDRSNQNKIRLLMRREKVQKLCCNQNLLKESKFIYPKNSKLKNSLLWVGNDFSENQLSLETFSIKFKTEEICSQFLKVIHELQSQIECDEKKQEKENSIIQTGFGDQFKLNEGFWRCSECFVQNPVELKSCLACKAPSTTSKSKPENLRPSKVESPEISMIYNSFEPTSINPSNQENLGKFANIEKSFEDKFKPVKGSWTCNSCYVQNSSEVLTCVACKEARSSLRKNDLRSDEFNLSKDCLNGNMKYFQPKQDFKTFSFGFSNINSNNHELFEFKPDVKFQNFEKILASQDNVFNSSNKINNKLTSKEKSDSNVLNGFDSSKAKKSVFSFMGEKKKSESQYLLEENEFNFGKKEFNFNLNKTHQITKTPQSFVKEDTEDSVEEFEEEESNVYFAPVVHLEKVEIKTGEENEEILYCHRAKLFRFVDKEWKERGIGEVKILKHVVTNKLRVIMRREQIFKICLNHVLVPELEYKLKDPKSWLFAVNDFSEGELELMQLCLRFKTKEIAENFMKEIKRALELASEFKNNKGNLNSSININHLQQGIKCRGCSPDDFCFPDIKITHQDQKFDPLPLTMPFDCTRSNSSNNILKQSLLRLGLPDDVKKCDNLFPNSNSKNCEKSDVLTLTNISNSIFQNNSVLPFLRSIETNLKLNNKEQKETSDLTEKSHFETKYNFDDGKSIDNKTTVINLDKNESILTVSQKVINVDECFKSNAENLVDFASLAKSANSNVYQQSSINSPGEFYGLIHQDSFRNFNVHTEKIKNQFNVTNSKKNENAEDDNNFDPYYKPVIELPKEITVSTGEENETKLFGERATLFRYDDINKEWKERGVGELKILYHPQNTSYRLLLRREQVHKLVLNHVICKDFSLSKMNNSTKSFCWAAINFIAEQPQVEKLAIRFKNSEAGENFQRIINESLLKMK